jgi:phosphoribosylformimino-5-aminoimidazole carboxamide ribotide isomerase
VIFPAIDLMDGGCVRLLKGDFAQRTNYKVSPIDTARGFERAGAKWLHVVDLDGAKNHMTAQSKLIIEIANATSMKIQTGGGLRDAEHIKQLLDAGVERVVIGSLAVKNPTLVKRWMHEFGAEKIVLAIDVVLDLNGIPRPATHGWTQISQMSLWDVISEFLQAGLKTVLVTDIAKDGVLKGANVNLYQEIMRRYSDLDLITSGGVGSLEDVSNLKALNPAGIIIGKALYENKFTLSEAIAC